MRTTITLDDELVDKAAELTGIRERTILLRTGLEALIQRETSRRLIALGGSAPGAKAGSARSAGDTVILVDTPIWIDHLTVRIEG